MTTYASGVSYAAQGGLATLTTGDGLARTIAYNDHLQMTSVAAGSLLSLGFGYSSTQNNGNLLSQTIATPGFSATQNYGYDGANRLTSASEGSTWGQTYVYDNVGNRAVLSSSSIPFSDATPQTGSTASVPYTAANRWTLAGYDSAGNMTAGNTQSARQETMAYDAEERMTQWADTNPSVSVTFTYDGDGRRVTKTWDGVTTVYVYDPLGNMAAEYGGSAAPVGGTLYLTQDQLGSTRLVSDYNAATGQPQAVGCHDYLPFGEEIPWGRSGVSCYSQTADTTIKFTGHERDSETGLDNFEARHMAGPQGRFLIPDPGNAGASPQNPQSWNMYGYVQNNPLAYVDPFGLACVYNGTGDQEDPANYHDDGSGGQSCSDVNASPPETTTVSSEPPPPVSYDCILCNEPTGGGPDVSGLPSVNQTGPVWFSVPNNGPAGAGTSTGACEGKILSAVNNHFGTNFTSANVGTGPNAPFQWPQVPGGTVNINVFPGQNQANGISHGRYPVNWWTYVIGYGSTLHIPAGPGGLDSPSTAVFSSSEFTAHLDSAFPYNPLGAVVHLLTDVAGVGGHQPCP